MPPPSQAIAVLNRPTMTRCVAGGMSTFKGSADDLRVYPRALTQAEVARLAAR